MVKKRRTALQLLRPVTGAVVGLGFVAALVGLVAWAPDSRLAQSIREWMTAIGTIGAVVVALGVTWSDRQRREREAAESVAGFQLAEAQSVIAFRETIPSEERELPMTFGYRESPFNSPHLRQSNRIVCENWSSLPVRGVVVEAHYVGDSPHIKHKAFRLVAGVIGPGQRATVTIHPGSTGPLGERDLQFDAAFTDARDQRWERGLTGLRRVASSPPV